MTDHDPSPETLDVAVAALHPSLEAILMVADQPLDKVQLASVVGHPVAVSDADEGIARAAEIRASLGDPDILMLEMS